MRFGFLYHLTVFAEHLSLLFMRAEKQWEAVRSRRRRRRNREEVITSTPLARLLCVRVYLRLNFLWVRNKVSTFFIIKIKYKAEIIFYRLRIILCLKYTPHTHSPRRRYKDTKIPRYGYKVEVMCSSVAATAIIMNIYGEGQGTAL